MIDGKLSPHPAPGQPDQGLPALSGNTAHSAAPDGDALLPRRIFHYALPLLLCLLMLGNSACSLGPKNTVSSGSASGNAVCKTALSTLGTPYRMGGTTPSKGFDCSGLVVWAYAKNGVKLPRTAREQSKVGRSVGKSSLQQGDIVVFKISSGMHTGIYTGSGKFVHSPSRGKTVRVDSINSDYWRNRFVAGRRV